MIKVERAVSDSFLKIVLYGTPTYENLNQPKPCYGNNRVNIVSITPVGTDKNGNPLFCYELKLKEQI